MKEYKEIFDYVNTTCWLDDTAGEVIIECAQRAFADITSAAEYTKQKKVYRLSGQSGTGKTTQLLPTITSFEEFQKRKPIIVGVRSCVTYHPKYDEYSVTIPKAELREKTNGFALKCLGVLVKLLFEHGYLIVLDLTVLDPKFEECILNHAQRNGYQIEYHIMAVSKKQSDAFIAKRANDANGAEKGRKVNSSSAEYFYDILPKGIEFLAREDKANICYIWSAFNLFPIYSGKLSGAPKALAQGRAIDIESQHTEEELRTAKLKYLIERKSN